MHLKCTIGGASDPLHTCQSVFYFRDSWPGRWGAARCGTEAHGPPQPLALTPCRFGWTWIAPGATSRTLCTLPRPVFTAPALRRAACSGDAGFSQHWPVHPQPALRGAFQLRWLSSGGLSGPEAAGTCFSNWFYGGAGRKQLRAGTTFPLWASDPAHRYTGTMGRGWQHDRCTGRRCMHHGVRTFVARQRRLGRGSDQFWSASARRNSWLSGRPPPCRARTSYFCERQ